MVNAGLAIHDTPFGKLEKYGHWVLEHLALNSGLYYALMAGMTAQLIGPSVPSESNTDLMRNAAKLRIQAMGHLRTRLSQPLTSNDDGIIFTILILALAEGILDNIPAFLIHRSQLRRLLKIRGSISNLKVDENTKAMIWRYVPQYPFLDVLLILLLI